MIESFGPRQTVLNGHAAALPAMQAGEKVVHRPQTKVIPTEQVDRNAPTGPRPTFQHTYLQRLSALWPNEPNPPATEVAYEREEAAPPEARPADEPPAIFREESAEPQPSVDIRR